MNCCTDRSLPRQHAPSLARQLVVAPPPLAGLLDPPAFDPAALLEAIQHRIERRDPEGEGAFGPRLDQLADLVAVARPLLHQRQHQQRRAPLLHFRTEHRRHISRRNIWRERTIVNCGCGGSGEVRACASRSSRQFDGDDRDVVMQGAGGDAGPAAGGVDRRGVNWSSGRSRNAPSERSSWRSPKNSPPSRVASVRPSRIEDDAIAGSQVVDHGGRIVHLGHEAQDHAAAIETFEPPDRRTSSEGGCPAEAYASRRSGRIDQQERRRHVGELELPVKCPIELGQHGAGIVDAVALRGQADLDHRRDDRGWHAMPRHVGDQNAQLPGSASRRSRRDRRQLRSSARSATRRAARSRTARASAEWIAECAAPSRARA